MITLHVVCWVKIEQVLVGERRADRSELELARSRVEELQEDQKTSHETIRQLSAQRDELQRSRDQLSDELHVLRTVSRFLQNLGCQDT